MAKYRKKPVVIDAERVATILYKAGNDWKALPDWVVKGYDEGELIFMSDAIIIKTLEGDMTAQKEDMLIMGISGELYPCKPDIFAKTYELVSDDDSIKLLHTHADINKKAIEIMKRFSRVEDYCTAENGGECPNRTIKISCLQCFIAECLKQAQKELEDSDA